MLPFYHLSIFFQRVAQEPSLNPTHISLYIALFQLWTINNFRNPVSISRQEVMEISKIASRVTYHKCIKKLQLLGFIDYKPSYNPFKNSQIYIVIFQ